MEYKRKMLPIGIENFQEMRNKDYYYVDKTDMIRELLANQSEVTLLTRPRRFGKTLNMSMLANFRKNTTIQKSSFLSMNMTFPFRKPS